MVEARLIDGSLPATPPELLAYLAELGVDAPTFEHEPVFTVEEAKALRGELSGAHTKNLFLRDKKGRMWLVTALEDRKIDLRSVAERLGHKRFSFGSAERLMNYLGVIPGAVTPFGVFNDKGGSVRVAFDTGLREHDVWNFHPLVNSMTTTVRPEEMLRFLEAVDHKPTWIDLGEGEG